VRRNGRWLVRGIDLTLRAGEIVSLIGPNGSGKSTTVKAILGVLDADEGQVERLRDIRVGYVPQKLSFGNTLPMTVRRLMTLTGPAGKPDIVAALDEVGIAHLADAPVHALSGGEFQRALLARAILRRPDLLVLDEPVQGVDFAGEIALYELIDSLRHRLGCGILLISHDLHIVMGRTDTVICLNGHVCCSGPPQSVAESPEYLALFGARGAEALAVYTHHHDHRHMPDGSVVPLAGASHDHADGHCHDHDHADGHEGQSGKRTGHVG
jgi:zinc transport system ATP-binding protein